MRPSQLLGGDLCRTEFMVHLFGTIQACKSSPLLEKLLHRCPLLPPPRSFPLLFAVLTGGGLDAKSHKSKAYSALLLYDILKSFPLLFASLLSNAVLSGLLVPLALLCRRRRAKESCVSPRCEWPQKTGPKKKEKASLGTTLGKVNTALITSCKFLLSCR